MQHLGIMKNPVLPYAWGSPTAIPELLGLPPDPDKPQAELWMGAHPKAPSRVGMDGEWVSLEELIERHPQAVLGPHTAAAFDNKLPYLFKVLAAAKPLSLQAHPDEAQARDGFARENACSIPLDAPQRNYRDANHKPECICALTPFWALHGFRKIAEMRTLAGRLAIAAFDDLLLSLGNGSGSQTLKAFFHTLMTLPSKQKELLTRQAAQPARRLEAEDPVYRWMDVLAKAYPGDIGILAPLFLNLVRLEPGQALYLPAAELHAYLEGVGIELMANSDNVLRGGLTSKHIDVAELEKVLHFEERTPHLITPRPGRPGELVYACPAAEFVLSVITVEVGSAYASAEDRSVEMLLCTAGSATVRENGSGEVMALPKGRALLVPAAVKSYQIAGRACIYKATVPH